MDARTELDPLDPCFEPAKEHGRKSGYIPSLRNIAEEALAQTDATGAAIVLKEDERLVCLASVGDSAPPVGAVLSLDQGLSGLCIKSGINLICTDVDLDSRVDRNACHELGIRSMVSVPVSCDGENIGLVEVFGGEPNAFHQDAIAALQRLSVVIAQLWKVAKPETMKAVLTTTVPEPRFFSIESSSGRIVILTATIVFAVIAVIATATLHWRHKDLVESAQTQDNVHESLPSQTSGPVTSGNYLDSEGTFGLANEFAQGTGANQNLIEAYAWYIISATQGNERSRQAIRELSPRILPSEIAEVRLRVGQILETGERVPKDLEAAYFWYSLADAANNAQAALPKKRVQAQLTNEQIEEGNSRVASWLFRHSAAPVAGSLLSDSR